LLFSHSASLVEVKGPCKIRQSANSTPKNLKGSHQELYGLPKKGTVESTIFYKA